MLGCAHELVLSLLYQIGLCQLAAWSSGMILA